MQRRGMTLVELVIVIAGIALMAVIFFPAIGHGSKVNAMRSSCQQNIRQVGLAMQLYLTDSDQAFPIIAVVNSATFGWADAVQPYLGGTEIFQCPSEETSKAAVIFGSQAGYTDYWYNAHLSGLTRARLKFPTNTLLLGDGNDGQELCDARYVKYSYAPDWYRDEKQPTYRHLDGANYGFTDGHVKWLKPRVITTDPPASTKVSFLPE